MRRRPAARARPGHVAAQAFEPAPVRACDPRCRMQPKAARSKAQGRRTHPGGRIFQDPAQALAGACPGGGEPSHRSRGESRQHRLLVGERIRCGIVEQAAFGAQADDAARTRLHDLLHGLVGQRRGGNENRSLLPIDADPVEHEHVYVGIEVQGGTESLDEGYRAPPRAVMAHGLRLTSIPAAHHAQKHRQYLRDPLAVVGEAVAHLVRKAEHLLAHRHPGAAFEVVPHGTAEHRLPLHFEKELAGERFPDARRGSGRGAPFPVRGGGTPRCTLLYLQSWPTS